MARSAVIRALVAFMFAVPGAVPTRRPHGKRAARAAVGLGLACDGDDDAVGRGPGKVTQAPELDRRYDRRDLARGELFVARYVKPSAAKRS